MKVLIVSATPFEAQLPDSLFQVFTAKGYNPNDGRIPVLVSGPGIMSCVFSLAETLQHYHPDIIINMGIAGSLKSAIKIGTHCVVASDYLIDSGIFRNNVFTHLRDCDFSLNNDKLFRATADILPLMPECSAVHGQTVGLFYDLPLHQRPEPYQQSAADIETMEGAAVFYVAASKGIPVCSIRTISNTVGIAHEPGQFLNAVTSNCAIIETLISRLGAS
ncbi:MAG TPA: hypothetical protein PLQ09_09050 [Prolixibacteraceae bacterium]|nr:hypothetical protein [Bacteroidales bacterium]HQN94256.1 hypothetical protein [Prolixibacteraceae bacterium]